MKRLILPIVLVSASVCFGQTDTNWLGTVDNNWFDADNWDQSLYPGDGTDPRDAVVKISPGDHSNSVVFDDPNASVETGRFELGNDAAGTMSIKSGRLDAYQQIRTSGDHWVGNGAGGDGVLNVEGGHIAFHVNSFHIGDNTATGTVNHSCGILETTWTFSMSLGGDSFYNLGLDGVNCDTPTGMPAQPYLKAAFGAISNGIGNAHMEMRSGTFEVLGNFAVGGQDQGSLNQTGGNAIFNQGLIVGSIGTSNGLYRLHGGTLTVNNHQAIVASSGTGLMEQTGGIATYNAGLHVGDLGSYVMSGGQANIGGVLSIDGGSEFTMTGGELNMTTLGHKLTLASNNAVLTLRNSAPGLSKIAWIDFATSSGTSDLSQKELHVIEASGVQFTSLSIGVTDPDDGNLSLVLSDDVKANVLTILGGLNYSSFDESAPNLFYRRNTPTDDPFDPQPLKALIPGDADLDGQVDGFPASIDSTTCNVVLGDFEAVYCNLFQTNTDWSSGDFNGDRVTDISDWNVYNSHRGMGPILYPASVPEPSALALVVFCSLFSVRRWREFLSPMS
jgi:hypothetical protein